MTQKYVLTKFETGLVDEDQISKLSHPEGACIDCENVVWMPGGAMTKRKGYEVLHSTAWSNSAITKIADYESDTGLNYSFVYSCASGAATAQIATVATTGIYADFTNKSDPSTAWDPEWNDPISFTSYCGSAVMTHWGNAHALFLWGEGSAQITPLTAGPSGAKICVTMGNYLFACNVKDSLGIQKRSRIQWCQSLTPNSWPPDYYIDLDAEDGDEITSAVQFQNKLVVFKKYKTYVVYWVGGTLMFKEELIDNGIGCLGPNAWCEDGGLLYFMGPYCMYSFDGRSSPKTICDPIQSTVNTMNMVYPHHFEVDSDPENWQIWFSMATGANTMKDMMLVYDTRFKSWTKYDLEVASMGGTEYGVNKQYQHYPLGYTNYSEKIRNATGEKQGVMFIGTYDGFLCMYGFLDNDGSSPIDAYWESKWLDMGDPTINKRFMRITVLLQKCGSYDLNFAFYLDWNEDTPALTRTVSLSGGLENDVIEKRIDFTHAFRACKVRIATSELNTPFIVHKIVIEYLTKGKTLVATS